MGSSSLVSVFALIVIAQQTLGLPAGEGLVLGLWQRTPNSGQLKGPLVATVDDVVAVLFTGDTWVGVEGFNATDGAPLWHTICTACPNTTLDTRLLSVGGVFIVNSGDVFASFLPATGAPLQVAALRSNVTLYPMGYNPNMQLGSGSKMLVGPNSPWIVMSVEGSAANTYGVVMLRASATSLQFTYLIDNPALSCGGDQVSIVYLDDAAERMVVVCSNATILLMTVPSTSAPAALLAEVDFPNMTLPSSVSAVSPSGEFGVAVAWTVNTDDGLVMYAAVAFPSLSWVNGISFWNYDTIATAVTVADNGAVVAFAGSIQDSGYDVPVGAWSLATGAKLWQQRVYQFPLAVTSVGAPTGSFLTFSYSAISVWNASTGATDATINLLSVLSSGHELLLTPIELCNPITSPETNTILCTTSSMFPVLAVTTHDATEFVDIYRSKSLVVLPRDDTDGGYTARPHVIPPSFMGGLPSMLDCGQQLQMYSLALLGWQMQAVSWLALPSGTGASFIGTEGGEIAAVDRGGAVKWAAPVASTGTTLKSSVLLGNDVLLTVLDDGFTIAAYNAYNGSLIATLWIPTDCNASIPGGSFAPAAGDFVLSRSGSSAYFVAGFPCLLRIDADLSIHSTPAPWPLTDVPTIDEDNSLAYVLLSNELYALHIASPPPTNVPTTFLVHTFVNGDYSPLLIVPSSQLTPQLGNVQPSPIVYLVTGVDVTAVDVLLSPNPLTVWSLPPFGELFHHLFYNNSLYVLTNTGVCRVLLDAQLPPGVNRTVWCRGSNAVANSAQRSNMIVSPDGVLLFLLDDHLYALDAVTGAGRWAPLTGYVNVAGLQNLGGCTISFLHDIYVVVILSDYGSLITVDALPGSLHKTMFFLPQWPTFATDTSSGRLVSYAQSTLVVPLGDTLGAWCVVGVMLPDFIMQRKALRPADAPTAPPAPNTLPPGFVPTSAPPSNVSYQYPQPTSTNHGVITPPLPPLVPSHQSENIGVSSALLPRDLFPQGAVVVGPLVSATTGTCYFDAKTLTIPYNASSPPAVSLWAGGSNFINEFVCAALGNGAYPGTIIRVVPTTVSSNGNNVAHVVVALLSGYLGMMAMNASSGQQLWNSSAFASSLLPSERVQYFPPQGAVTDTIIVITTLRLLSINLMTGEVRAAIAVPGIAPGISDPWYRVHVRVSPRAEVGHPTPVSVTFSSANSQLVVIVFNHTNATVVHSLDTQLANRTWPCAIDGNVVLATVPNGISPRDFGLADYVYVACIDAVTASNGVVLRLSTFSSALTVVGNFTMESGESGVGVMMVDDQTNPLAPVAYVMTGQASRFVNLATGSVVVSYTSFPFQSRFILSGPDQVILMTTEGSMTGVNKHTGDYLWSAEIGAVDDPIDERFNEQILAVTLDGDLLILSTSSNAHSVTNWVGVNTSSGGLQYSNTLYNGYDGATALELWPATLNSSAGGSQVLAAVASTFASVSTGNPVLVAVFLPVVGLPNIATGCFDADMSMVSQLTVPGGIVAVDNTLVTNFEWVSQLPSVPDLIFTVPSSVLGYEVLVAMSFSRLTILRADTGTTIASVHLMYLCPSLQLGNQGVQPSYAIFPAGSTQNAVAVLWDGYCVYRWDMATLPEVDITALAISDSAVKLFVGLKAIQSAQLVILYTEFSGLLIAVDIVPKTPSRLWVSDTMDLLNCQGAITTITLPYSPTFANATTRSRQQFIASCNTAVAGLSLDSGVAVWFEALDGPFPSSATAILGPDGNVVVFGASNITKYSAIVSQESHVLWSRPVIARTLWGGITLVPNTDIVVAAVQLGGQPMTIQVIQLSSGQTLYSINDECSEVTFGPTNGVGEPPAVMFLCGVRCYSLFDGTYLYSISSPITQFSGNVALQCNQGSCCAVNYLVDTISSILPSYAPPSPVQYPLIPVGYAPPSMPLPTTAPALPLQHSGAPYPVLMWKSNIDPTQAAFNGYYSLINGINTAVLISHNGSTYEQGAATLIAIDAATGAELVHKNIWSSNCDGQWLGKLSSSFGIVTCHPHNDYNGVNFSFALIDTRTVATLGDIVGVISGAQLGLGSIPSNDFTVIPVNDTMACVAYGYATQYQQPSSQTSGVICIDLLSVGTDGPVQSVNIQCPAQGDSGYLTAPPVYSNVSGTLWMPCFLGQQFYFGLVSMTIAEQSETLYITTWDYYYTSGIGPIVLTPDHQVIACAVSNQYYNTSLAVIAIADGVSILNISTPISSAAPFFVGLAPFTPPAPVPPPSTTFDGGDLPHQEYLVVFGLAGDDIRVYDTTTGDAAWVVDPANDPASINAVIAPNPHNPGHSMLVVVTTTDDYPKQSLRLIAYDMSTGSEVFNITTTVNDNEDLNPTPTMTLLYNSTHLAVNYGPQLVIYNLVSQRVVVALQGDTIEPNGVLSVADHESGSFVVDVMFSLGYIEQVLLFDNVARSEPLAVDNFNVLPASTPSGGAVVAFEGTATYLLDGTGSTLWGTDLEVPSLVQLFPTIAFTVPNSQQTLLINSATSRLIYALDIATGNLVYLATLPLCGLAGSASMSASLDAANGVLLVVTGTKCLYMIAAATGEVSIVSTSTVPLLPFVLVSTHCVLTVTVFGSVQCHSRSASVTEVLWSTDFGFAPPTAGSNVPPIVVGSGLLLVTLGERVIALDDATGVIAWEHRASSTVSISVVNNNLVAASCGEVVSIPLDPVSNPSGSPAWRANTSGFLSAASAAPCTKVLAPALTAAGTIVATFGNVLGAWNAVDGSFAYVQYANGGVCNRLYVPPFTSEAATPQNNVFIASCGQTEVRSVATGVVIAYIGERENSAYCPSPIAIIPSTGKVVFCSSDGMTIESIPSFIASLAPPVVQVPTAPPMSFTIPPGATPFGVPTPAPTYPDLPDDRIPDASCVWAMQDLYPSLAACVVNGLTAAFNASLLSEQNGMMNCSSTARSLSPCISSWLTQAASPPLCPGALVYLNTILQSLNHTGALGVCHQAAQCVDGAAGSALLCSLVNSATAGADGLVFSSAFVSRLPPPINTLPCFQAQPPPPPNHLASPGSTMSSGAVAGIVVGVLCALLIILAVFRKRAKARELEARLDEANNNHDGPIVVSSRSGSELGSVHAGSKGRLLEVNQEAYASIN